MSLSVDGQVLQITYYRQPQKETTRLTGALWVKTGGRGISQTRLSAPNKAFWAGYWGC